MAGGSREIEIAAESFPHNHREGIQRVIVPKQKIKGFLTNHG